MKMKKSGIVYDKVTKYTLQRGNSDTEVKA